MANDKCEAAREYIVNYIKENDIPASTSQIEEVVSACCNDITSQECNEAISKLAVTVACSVYTEGVCIPCCETLGNIAGPILAKGIKIQIDIIKGVWNFVSGLFGGGDDEECDKVKAAYKLSGDALVIEYARAGNAALDALAESCSTVRVKTIGMEALDNFGMNPIVKRNKDGFYYATFIDDPERKYWASGSDSHANWAHVILNNVAHRLVLAGANGPPWGPNGRTWTITGTDDKVISPPLDINNPPQDMLQLFGFYWESFSCKQPNRWRQFAEDVQELRYTQFLREVDIYLEDFMYKITQKIEDDKKMKVPHLNFTPLQKASYETAAVIGKKSSAKEGSNFWWWALGIGTVAAAGGTGYYFWNRK